MTDNKQNFDTLYNNTSCLSKISTHDDIKDVMNKIALGQFPPIELDRLLRLVSQKTGSGIKVIKQEYDLILKELNLVPMDVGFDVAKAMLVKFYNGSNLKLYPDGNFYTYDKTHWRLTTKDQVRSNLQNVAADFLIYCNKSLQALVSDALSSLSDYLGTDIDVLNFQETPEPVINCKNGELWINPDGTVDLRPHKPESRLFACLPFDYDPAAKSPKYDKAILEIFASSTNSTDMVRHWHEFFGYAIQPNRFIASFFMLIGFGRNGKSKCMATIERILGPDTVLNDNLQTFQKDRFNAAALHGKLLFIDDDIETEIMLADGMLKNISEAKMMSARHPYGRKKFSFKCVALPVLIGNHYPACKDLSEGMIRRINIIPFDRQFTAEEADPNLFDNIWANEMPGVLNHALAGLQRIIKRETFKQPDDCENAKADFLSNGNPMFCFLSDCLTAEAEGRIKLPEFRAYFDVWAKSQGFTKKPVLDKTLKRQLEGMGFEIVKNNGVNTIKGFSFQNSNNPTMLAA